MQRQQKTEQNKIKQNDNCSRRCRRRRSRQQRENNQRHLNWFAARISQVSKSEQLVRSNLGLVCALGMWHEVA